MSPRRQVHLWTTSANFSLTFDFDQSPGSAGYVVFVKICSGLVPLTRRIAMFKPHRLLCATGNPDDVILEAARPSCPPSAFWSSTVSGRVIRDTFTLQVSPSTPLRVTSSPSLAVLALYTTSPSSGDSSGCLTTRRAPAYYHYAACPLWDPRSRDAPSSTSQVREDLSRPPRGLSLCPSPLIFISGKLFRPVLGIEH